MHVVGVECLLQVARIARSQALVSFLAEQEVLARLRLHDQIVLDALERVAVVADVEAGLELVVAVRGAVVAGSFLAHLVVEVDPLWVVRSLEPTSDTGGCSRLLE